MRKLTAKETFRLVWHERKARIIVSLLFIMVCWVAIFGFLEVPWRYALLAVPVLAAGWLSYATSFDFTVMQEVYRMCPCGKFVKKDWESCPHCMRLIINLKFNKN